MIFEDREFYDLCRKYKYYYKAYQEFSNLKNIYWSQYMRDAYKDLEKKLSKVEEEMINCMLDSMISTTDTINIQSNVIEPDFGFSSRMSPFVNHIETMETDSPKLIRHITILLQRRYAR